MEKARSLIRDQLNKVDQREEAESIIRQEGEIKIAIH